MIQKPKMVDRRRQALGYPGHGAFPKRHISAIKAIVWHYTGTDGGFITGHENYWRNNLGWNLGGYTYYIATDGTIYWNYDLEICTYGAGSANPWTCHISLEASHKNKYTQAQIAAREQLTLWLLTYLNLPAHKVLGHKEVPGNSTTCPGYSTAELNAFRNRLAQKLNGSSAIQNAGAPGFLKYEYGKFTVSVDEGIIIRDGVGLKATKIGLLKKGESVVYTDVYVVDGYVWIRYGAGTHSRFVPVRQVNKEAWGTFADVPRQDNDQIAKEVLAGIWGNGNLRKARLEHAKYHYQTVQDRVQGLKVIPKADVRKEDKPMGKTTEDREIMIDGKVYVVVEK